MLQGASMMYCLADNLLMPFSHYKPFLHGLISFLKISYQEKVIFVSLFASYLMILKYGWALQKYILSQMYEDAYLGMFSYYQMGTWIYIEQGWTFNF